MIAQLDMDYIRTRPYKAASRLASYVLFQGRPLLGRWRWLNPLLFAQFNFVKRMPQLKKVEKPLYIVGIGRSGTTIMGKILSMHSHINFLNEPKALWHAIYPEEDVIGSYSRGLAHYRLGAEDVTPQVRRAAHCLYGYCLALTASKRILDKYPSFIFREYFLKAIFPDAKLIFLVRNGWDTIRSIVVWSERRGKKVGQEVYNWWGADRRKWRLLVEDIVASDPMLARSYAEIAAFTRNEDMAAVEWVVTMQQGLRLKQYMPDSIYQVRYEELTAHPERTLKNLLAFCELPHDPTLLSYAQRVLASASSKKPLLLHPAVEGHFLETMQTLNYPVERKS